MKTFKRIAMMGLAAMMAVSAMSISAFAEENVEDNSGLDYINSLIESGDVEKLESDVIISENGEIKQVTPIDSDLDNLSTQINGDAVYVLDENENVVDIIPIEFNINDISSVRADTGTKYKVVGNNVNLRNRPYGDVIITLEYGVYFWGSWETSGWTYGYVNSGSSKIYGYVSSQYLQEM